MWRKDNVLFGIMLAAVSTALSCAVVWALLYALGFSVSANSKLFLFSFVPAILLLRMYTKWQYLKTVKGLLTVIFFGFCLMLYGLYAAGAFAGRV